MNVLHIIPYVGRRQGGPVIALADLTSAQSASGCNVTIAAIPKRADEPHVEFGGGVRICRAGPSVGRMFRWCPSFMRDLVDVDADVVHSHGLWTYASAAAGSIARRRRIPHVLAPCGMLLPGARRRSHLKKAICRRFFQDRVLREATCLHAKSATEATGLRSFGLRNPMARVPNPVHLPAGVEQLDPTPFRRAHGLSDTRRTVLYLGRIHPVKGLLRLAQAWCRLPSTTREWQLVIAGPDEVGHQEEVECILRQAGRSEAVVFAGHVHDEIKWMAFQAADLFVMPSDFENFGTAVGEALAAGLPVITTTGTPWLHLNQVGCGWCVPPTVESLADTLENAMQLSDERRQEMGQKGRQLAGAFSPMGVASRMLAVYKWAVEGGDMPPHVGNGSHDDAP